MWSKSEVTISEMATRLLFTVFEIAGIVIGYVIVGGFKLYQMTCKSEHSKKIANISTRLTKQLDRYTESQNKLFQVTFCLLDSEFYVIG